MRIMEGDALTQLCKLADESVHCCVTSPPYWGLRAYPGAKQIWGGDPHHSHVWGAQEKGRRKDVLPSETSKAGRLGTHAHSGGQNDGGHFCACGAWLGALGLEPTPDLYTAHVVEVFREVRRVLRNDGTLWLNMGDCYATKPHGYGPTSDPKYKSGRNRSEGVLGSNRCNNLAEIGLKGKDLVGMPWRVAFALQADGWYLRSDIIWHKPNPMPESVTDRPTKAHEYIFLLSKSARYYYDADAIKEPFQTNPKENYPARAKITGRGKQGGAAARGNDRDKSGGFPPRPCAGWHQGTRAEGSAPRDQRLPASYNGSSFTRGKTAATKPESGHGSVGKGPRYDHEGRNKRSVWTVATHPWPGAHFATFPPKLIEPCILAGCPPGGIVLDPFAGAFTVALVCQQLGRDSIAVELSREYIAMGVDRLGKDLARLKILAKSA